MNVFSTFKASVVHTLYHLDPCDYAVRITAWNDEVIGILK